MVSSKIRQLLSRLGGTTTSRVPAKLILWKGPREMYDEPFVYKRNLKAAMDTSRSSRRVPAQSRLFTKKIGNETRYDSVSASSSSNHRSDSSLRPAVPVVPARRRPPLLEVWINGGIAGDKQEIRLAGNIYLDDEVSVSSDITCEDRIESHFFRREDKRKVVRRDNNKHGRSLFKGRIASKKKISPISTTQFNDDEEESYCA